MIFNERRARIQPGPPLAGYPTWARPLILWYDDLTDWQRVQYALAAILFLVACTGYLLGLGSTMVVQRVAFESEALAAAPLPTVATSAPTEVPLAAPPTSTPTAVPSPTPAPPTPLPVVTPFAAPQIAEPPAAPRSIPALVPPAPAAPVRLASPTPDRPRNLETKPDPPAATPTPRLAATVLPSSATRQPTSGTPGARPTSGSGTALPTLALPATRALTPGPTQPPTPPQPTATPRSQTTPSTVKTPPVR